MSALLTLSAVMGCAASDTASTGHSDGGLSDAAAGDRPSGASGGSFGSGGSTSTGGQTAGSGGTTGIGTGGASSTGGSAGGAGGSASGCFITLDLVAPQIEENLISGTNARVRMLARVFNFGSKPAVWKWNIEYRSDPGFPVINANVVVSADGSRSSTADFPVKVAGHYEVSVEVDSGVRCEGGHKGLLVNLPMPATYRFRVIPPLPLNLEIPVQESLISLTDPNTGLSDRRLIVLLRGVPRAFNVATGANRNIPAYVRVGVVPAGVAAEGYTVRGPFSVALLPRTTYDVMFVPDGDFAPLRLSATADSHLSDFNPVALDQGTMVRGSLLDGEGLPVAGARVVLRDGNLPSTIGVSNAAGQFSLWARPGVLSAVVVPPTQSGLPETRVPSVPGIVLDQSAMELVLSWNRMARGALSVAVKTNDGKGAVPGARVHIEPSPGAEILDVGTLYVSGIPGATLMAIGGARLDLVTDAAGVARTPNLPVGAYRITVVPTAEMPEAALTTRYVTLASAGTVETIPLARHLTITGTLLPKGATAGVRIIARDQSSGVVAPVTSGTVGPQGTYSLPVDPSRSYQLVADPPLGSGFARTVLATKEVDLVDPVPPDYTVASAVDFRGSVMVEGGGTIANALVQVFCLGSALDCVDPETAIAETVTSPTGTFTVALPAPTLAR